MRLLFFCTLFLISTSSLLARGLKSGVSGYEVVSDIHQSTIKEGYFTISGVIEDAVSNEPIVAANITNKSMLNRTVSNFDGSFSLSLPITDSTVFCYATGFNEIEIKGPFKSQHLIQVRVSLTEMISVAFKPVIYAYNSSQPVKLSLKPQGQFTFTYPQTADGCWEITANEEGTLTSLVDGKNYPYLFWEGELGGLKVAEENGTAEGFLLKTDTCISFFENTLAAYGLNEKETTDLITFWAPKMMDKPFAFIQFLHTETYANSIASLQIDPMPETLLRLYLLMIPLDSPELPFEVKSPIITPLTRHGFTVIEWGGSILNLPKQVN